MSTQSKPDEAYYDRNQAVMMAAKLAAKLGYTVGVRPDEDEPGWTLVYIELPTGQVSWHLPDAELTGLWRSYESAWDGHTVEEKRERIAAFLRGDETV